MEVAVVVPTVTLVCAGTVYIRGKVTIDHRQSIKGCTELTSLSSNRFTVESYITLLIHSSYLNGVAGGGSQSSQ